eukprot:12424353-Karenia_brevis.AAC.1
MCSEGLSRDVISFNAAISAYDKVGQWQRVAPLLAEMRLEGLSLDVISFSAAISVYEKGGQWHRVTL